MSNPNIGGEGNEGDKSWEELLQSLFGPEMGNEIARQMREQGQDLSSLAGGELNFALSAPQVQEIVGKLQNMMSAQAGPLNWEMARDFARQFAHRGDDPLVTAAQAAQVRQALAVADLWLDTATVFTPASTDRFAWTRSEWVDATLSAWRQISEPMAANAARALSEEIGRNLGPDQENIPAELRELLGGVAGPGGAIANLSAAVFGMQIGQAVGSLAREALGSTDVGFPLTDSALTALIPANIADFSADLGVPGATVVQFLAVREAALARLFGQVPWLRSHVLGTIAAYARGISINTAAIEEAVRSVDPFDTAQMREALSGGLFTGPPTPGQQRALANLETVLAVIEGWVEVVSGEVLAAHLPEAMALQEVMRRRRATGGPAEQIFASLLGLELRPRRSREAALLWRTYGSEVGMEERDALWSHPDLIPTAGELDNPTGFSLTRQAAQAAEAAMDEELAALLDGTWRPPDTEATPPPAETDKPAGEESAGENSP